jgi:Lrp/AsnC family transcriptional regulator, leucine-responsive regulatory protein
MASSPLIDPTDKRILAILQQDGRRRNTELADAINMTPAPCLRRVKELEESGVIRKYVALVEPRLVGLNLTALIEVKLLSQTQARLESFERTISKLPNVLECFLVTGDWDYVLKVVVGDLDEYQKFLVTQLTALRDVQNLKSTIVMKSVKQTTALHLP